MKILFVHTFYRFKGGEDNLVIDEMALLQSAGFTVELMKFKNSDTFLGALLPVFFLPFNLFSFWAMVKKIRKFQPEVVHVHNWHFAASPSTIVACHYCKVPVVLSLHNYRLICPSATLLYNGELFLDSITKKFPWKGVMLGVYRDSIFQTFWLAFTIYLHKKLKTWQKVSAYIVNSEFEIKVFMQSTLGIPEKKFLLKSNSIPDPSFEEETKRKDHFLFIGRFVSEKGIEVLLDAFSKVPFKLVIYGYGPMDQDVKESTRLHPNISCMGALSHDKLSEELRNCTALVFPSIWYEGMPLTLLHAFSTGTPIIASNIGAMSTMIEDHHNGLHFKTGDAADLAQKLAYWNNLPESEKEAYGLRSRKTYEDRYTPESNLKSLRLVYDSVIK
ncbi:MAG: glycosyltransferase family 4 protein [Haliscomenobacter sp.]|uniref:glycosyltransferase family 4 protein n=1 Tax=Haliscomenobacter sp. TaxID=2717303 RepID=UPI0029ABE13F|nr:glycosyltransferase family 4 protein [Haliscomenobacter sp.]MDX2072286.1 glycosyltransferase family 4 protein [Haliscomenobacter sp.]